MSRIVPMFKDEKEQKSAGRESLRKALEFQRAAETLLAAGNLNAAGLLAVHAGWSAVNAVTITDYGVVSLDGTYMDVVRLVARDRDRRQASLAIKLGELLGTNHSFETGRTKAGQADAKRVVKLAAKVVDAAEDILRNPWTVETKAPLPTNASPNLLREGRKAR